MPQKNPERLKEIRRLRLEGYVAAKHRVPIRKGAKTDYLTCSECDLLYSKRNFYKHYRKCSGKRAPKNIGNIMKTIESLNQENKPGTFVSLLSDPLKKLILPKISDEQNNLIEAIVNDKGIIEYGNSLCMRFGNDLERQQNLIRNKLRAIAKFKIQMSEKDGDIKNVIDIFDPNHWNLFIETVKVFSKLEETTIEKQSPSNVKHIGLLLSNVAKDLEVTCIEDLRVKTIKRWLKLYTRSIKARLDGREISLQYKKNGRQTNSFL